MMIKFLEIRDRHTTVPAMAIEISSADGPVVRHAGFGPAPSYLLINLGRIAAEYDPYAWDRSLGRTIYVAHVWIQDHFDQIPSSGGVVDVEFILGERETPKRAECV